MAVSNETANKLLQGGFTTFEELDDYERNLASISYKQIQILLRIKENELRKEQVYIIETIFIDE